MPDRYLASIEDQPKGEPMLKHFLDSREGKVAVFCLVLVCTYLGVLIVATANHIYQEYHTLKRASVLYKYGGEIITPDWAYGCERFTLLSLMYTNEGGYGEMVERPRAKNGDLAIVYRDDRPGPPRGTFVVIRIASDKAEAWLLENAPRYGEFQKAPEQDEYFLLTYTHLWDVDWVLAWLEQMGETIILDFGENQY